MADGPESDAAIEVRELTKMFRIHHRGSLKQAVCRRLGGKVARRNVHGAEQHLLHRAARADTGGHRPQRFREIDAAWAFWPASTSHIGHGPPLRARWRSRPALLRCLNWEQASTTS